MFGRKPAESVTRLRDVLSSATNGDKLRGLPDQFAKVIDGFERSNCHPALRQDIYTILTSALNLSESLLDETYPTDTATHSAAEVLRVLQKILIHLEAARPGRVGYAILLPETGAILPQVYSSESEATAQLSALQQLALPRTCIVIPVKITSQHAVQPRAAPPLLSSDSPSSSQISPEEAHFPLTEITS